MFAIFPGAVIVARSDFRRVAWVAVALLVSKGLLCEKPGFIDPLYLV